MGREILRLRMLAIENRVATQQGCPVDGLKEFVAAALTALTTGIRALAC